MTAMLVFRSIGPVPVSVILKEDHKSSLAITDNAVENGAKITDHAHVEPKTLDIEFADSNAAQTYNALVAAQEQRAPFSVVTGLYVYKDMLPKELTATRDARTARIVKGTASLRQVVLVETAYTEGSGDKAGQAGGKKSTSSAKPGSSRSGDAATRNRASGPVARGDQTSSSVNPPAKADVPARNQSGLYRYLYGQ